MAWEGGQTSSNPCLDRSCVLEPRRWSAGQQVVKERHTFVVVNNNNSPEAENMASSGWRPARGWLPLPTAVSGVGAASFPSRGRGSQGSTWRHDWWSSGTAARAPPHVPDHKVASNKWPTSHSCIRHGLQGQGQQRSHRRTSPSASRVSLVCLQCNSVKYFLRCFWRNSYTNPTFKVNFLSPNY